MNKIISLKARQIFDSRGVPTVEADLVLEGGFFGQASVPSGASTGFYEAFELRDDYSFLGKEVLTAVRNVNTEIADKLMGQSFDQEKLDYFLIDLDGTENKSRLGANAILSVSLSFARAVAKKNNKWLYQDLNTDSVLLPMPMLNFLNGGKHSNWSSDIQEFMIIPVSAKSFKEAMFISYRVFQSLKKILGDSGKNILVGDEGGFAPLFSDQEEPFLLLGQAIEMAGFKLGKDVCFAIDVAASEIYQQGVYNFSVSGKKMRTIDLIDFYCELVDKYPIISIEDPFDQDDFFGFSELTKKIGNKVQIVGDDLFATNCDRLQKGIDNDLANAILIKPNQIGTLSETKKAIDLANSFSYQTIISHRSGETEDPIIADLAVGFQTGQIKAGSFSRSDRMAKYNQLLRIEEDLTQRAVFKNPFSEKLSKK